MPGGLKRLPLCPSSFYSAQMLNGVTLGSTYALDCYHYTMVYGIIGMINFCSWRGVYDRQLRLSL